MQQSLTMRSEAPTATPESSRRPSGPVRPLTVGVAVLAALAAAATTGLVPTGRDDVPLTDAELAVAETELSVDNWLAACLAEKGFPQMKTALAYRTAEPEQVRGILYWNPYEAGPVTADVATNRGFLGTPELFTESRRAEIVGPTAAYDQHYQQCVKDLDSTIEQSYSDSMTEWFEFSVTLRHQFIAGIEPSIVELSDRLISCMNQTNPGAADDMMSFDKMLATQGIEPGEYHVSPEELIATIGGLQVTQTPDPVYTPSPAEVSLAQDFARCVDSTEFLPTMKESQIDERNRLLDVHHDELARWVDWADSVRRQLQT